MVKTLEQKTQDYWSFLMQVNEKVPVKKPITCEKVLAFTGDSLNSLGPQRPLARLVAKLRHDVIAGGKRSKSGTAATVTQLRVRG